MRYYITTAMKTNRDRFRRTVFHCLTGAFLGFFALHPVSMLIFYNFERMNFSIGDILLLSLSHHHLTMALFFALLGAISGIINSLYVQRITKLYDEVKKLSLTDELTTVCNRRYFFKKLKEELNRARRYSRGLYLFMIDIDNFKHFNDDHGHLYGDNILRIFGQYLKESTRTSDVVARYGGEEFAVILPESDAATASKMANRLIAGITENDIFRSMSLPSERFTISIGIAGFSPDAQDPDDIITKADQALYQAKREGKNRIHGL